ncbi:hypothetical protein QT970_01655 [Microcoleus sp. herbarium8]|uniref:hypothetical protein n=1 Tax=Microcoleus sp. herbarium8 TaxID=3055436 RepID=UPI002FCED099
MYLGYLRDRPPLGLLNGKTQRALYFTGGGCDRVWAIDHRYKSQRFLDFRLRMPPHEGDRSFEPFGSCIFVPALV